MRLHGEVEAFHWGYGFTHTDETVYKWQSFFIESFQTDFQYLSTEYHAPHFDRRNIADDDEWNFIIFSHSKPNSETMTDVIRHFMHDLANARCLNPLKVSPVLRNGQSILQESQNLCWLQGK